MRQRPRPRAVVGLEFRSARAEGKVHHSRIEDLSFGYLKKNTYVLCFPPEFRAFSRFQSRKASYSSGLSRAPCSPLRPRRDFPKKKRDRRPTVERRSDERSRWVRGGVLLEARRETLEVTFHRRTAREPESSFPSGPKGEERAVKPSSSPTLRERSEKTVAETVGLSNSGSCRTPGTSRRIHTASGIPEGEGPGRKPSPSRLGSRCCTLWGIPRERPRPEIRSLGARKLVS